MSKANSYNLAFPVFAGYLVTVVFTKNVRKALKLLGGKGSKNVGACHVTKTNEPGHAWLIFSPNPDPDVIAHECWHCVYALLKYAGAKVEDEVVAYHLGYADGKVHEFLRLEASE